MAARFETGRHPPPNQGRVEVSETSSHTEKAIALAEKITAKAEDSVARLEREMIIMKWPAEFRVIMWEAVVEVAAQRAESAKRTPPQ